jgi:glutamine synthetase
MADKQSILTSVYEQGVRFIDLWFTDITGVVKSVTVPASGLAEVLENGSGFDGSAVEGFARVAESDMVLMPDLDTFALLPWSRDESTRSARLICSVHMVNGEPFIGDPRNVLKRAIRHAEEMGFRYQIGSELEFFLFRANADGVLAPLNPSDGGSYFDLTPPASRGVLREMAASLDDLGVPVDSLHHEIGAGQHEIDLDYAGALTAADRVLTTRVALKEMASRGGFLCTFMPRPDARLPGSGMHTHQSLHALDDDSNAFVDTNDPYGLSQIGKYFLAGQLTHARAMCAVLAPLVNSYKRLGTSFEAPVAVTWAHVNRRALIRVPHIIAGKEQHTRLELRCPDPAANPYLATAVMLMAGLDGIRQRMALPEPQEESLLTRGRTRGLEVLPGSLGEALEALGQDEVILSALGAFISDRYIVAKQQEYEDYARFVTQWELERYLNQY